MFLLGYKHNRIYFVELGSAGVGDIVVAGAEAGAAALRDKPTKLIAAPLPRLPPPDVLRVVTPPKPPPFPSNVDLLSSLCIDCCLSSPLYREVVAPSFGLCELTVVDWLL